MSSWAESASVEIVPGDFKLFASGGVSDFEIAASRIIIVTNTNLLLNH